MMTTPPEAQGAPPQWGCYVTVDDVDATAAQAAEMGGVVLMPPRDIPDVGRFCLIQDPQGAVISAITYRQPQELALGKASTTNGRQQPTIRREPTVALSPARLSATPDRAP